MKTDPLVVEYFGMNERDLYHLQDSLLAQRMEIDSFATLAAAV